MNKRINEAAEEILELITTKGTAKWVVMAYLADEDRDKQSHLEEAAKKLYYEGFLDVKKFDGLIFYFKTEKAIQYRIDGISFTDYLKRKERGMKA